VRDYDVVAIEKLNIRGLARGPLAKDVHDAGWATFISMLRYKAACAGTRLVEVDPRGTSQELDVVSPSTGISTLHETS
jgi:putative transposase